jgi:hypothetical protein
VRVPPIGFGLEFTECDHGRRRGSGYILGKERRLARWRWMGMGITDVASSPLAIHGPNGRDDNADSSIPFHGERIPRSPSIHACQVLTPATLGLCVA